MLEGGKFKLNSNRGWLSFINLLFALMFAMLLVLLSGDLDNVDQPERGILIGVGIVGVPLICIIIGTLIIGKSYDGGRGLIMFGIFSLGFSSLLYTGLSKPKGEKETIAIGYTLMVLIGAVWIIIIASMCNLCATTSRGKPVASTITK